MKQAHLHEQGNASTVDGRKWISLHWQSWSMDALCHYVSGFFISKHSIEAYTTGLDYTYEYAGVLGIISKAIMMSSILISPLQRYSANIQQRH